MPNEGGGRARTTCESAPILAPQRDFSARLRNHYFASTRCCFPCTILGEDGRVWCADVDNCGWWATLFRAHYGYLEIFPRLGASLALLAPLALAPLPLNSIAIAVQALPANLLLSVRSSVWGSLRYRFLLAGMYLSLPNCWELNATITNSQWTLALIAVLLVVAARPHGIAGRLLDLGVASLCGLNGPFCIFLFPIALFLAWKHRAHRHSRRRDYSCRRMLLRFAPVDEAFPSLFHYASGRFPHRSCARLAQRPHRMGWHDDGGRGSLLVFSDTRVRLDDTLLFSE